MKHFCILSALLSVSVLYSCTPLYCPTSPHLPMINEKGVTELNALIGVGEESGCIDLNLAHSVSNHAGIMLNYSGYKGLDDEEGGRNFDFGLGYYTPIEKKGGFETYAIVGYGANDAYDATCLRLAVQPDIFYSGKHFEAGLGFRLQYLDYDRTFTTNSYYYSPYESSQLSDNFLLMEPTLKLSVGGETVKFSIQNTFSMEVTGKALDLDPYVISFGFTFKFPAGRKRLQ